MKMIRVITLAGILLLLAVCLASAQDEQPTNNKTWLWVGSHYTEFTDYTKKVGEYRLGDNEWLPAIGLYTFQTTQEGFFELAGKYYDDQNIVGRLNGKVSDWFSGSIQYRSMIRQMGQDLLENIEAREYNPGTGAYGGKTITHEILDPGADYNYNRHEVLSQVQLLLSRKNNVRFIAAHRSIVKKGEEQKISNSHCFSCHLESQTALVDRSTNSIEAGIQADAKDMTFGYMFGYRQFRSEAPEAKRQYDSARHPAIATFDHAEFISRMNFSDSTLPFGVYAETEKTSHKLRIKGKLGKGQLSSSLVFSKTRNEGVDLESQAILGTVNYSLPVGQRSRLIARANFKSIEADDPNIDLIPFRDNRGGPANFSSVDFDFTRYSSLDRTEFKGSAEMITKPHKRWTVAGLLGYHKVDRADYPLEGDGISSGTLIAQAKVKYRKGLRYSSSLKARLEKTSDPFVSGRGLFEESIRDSLTRAFKFIFYHEREDFRYQNITTSPTDHIEFAWNSNWRPNMKTNLTLGVKYEKDKNGDLDSLDVESSVLQPHANLTYTPNAKWAVTAGYNYREFKSRGPVTVALFDG